MLERIFRRAKYQTAEEQLISRLTETALRGYATGDPDGFGEELEYNQETDAAADRLAALLVGEEEDQAVLSELAASHLVRSVRIAAIGKLISEAFLIGIATAKGSDRWEEQRRFTVLCG